MVNEQLFLAVDLILAKRYDDARQLLRTIDHPKAREWLVRLDVFTAQPTGKTDEILRVVAAQFHPKSPPASPDASAYLTPPSINFPLVAASPPASAMTFPLALLGGLLGAAVGAVVWIVASLITGYETTLAAVLIGALAGAGGVWLSGGRRGGAVRVAAVLATLIGFALAEYFSLYLMLLGDPANLLNGSANLGPLRTLPPFSQQMIEQIRILSVDYSSPLDLIFLIVALVTAWRIVGRKWS